nr:hypothetical protein [Tanacetum cinerariifolium]
TNLQCDYLELLEKCEGLETKLSKSKMISKSFKALQKHTINLEIDLQQCQEKIKHDKSFIENLLKEFRKEREQYFEIQDLKAQLQDKGIVIRMYKLHTYHIQARTSQLPQDSRKTNKRVSFSTRVIPTTSVSRPQLKSNPMGDRVMRNNSQGKKQEVEDQSRNVKLPKNKTSIIACNDSLNAKTLNVKSISAMCDKCIPLCQILHCLLILLQLVEIVLFIVDSGCSKHMTGNLKLLINFMEKFLGTVKLGNDQIAPILGYRDMKSTCFIHDLKGDDLLTGSHGTDLYSITLHDTNCPNPICLMAKATSSQAWLWHRRLSRLNFDTINLLSKNDIMVGLPKLKFIKDHLCSSYELGKAKRKSFHTKLTPSSKRQLQLLHMDLCGPMRVASINGKRYVLVIVDDYFRYTWTHFLRSKDETPKVLIDFLRLVQRGLQAQKGFITKRPLLEHLNKMALSKDETVHFQNRSLLIPRHEKTPYHIINDRKSSVKFFHIFGSLCYIVKDGENLGKIKEKGDECILVGYSTQSRAYRVFNKKTKVIMEYFHVNFDELPHMASDHISSNPAPEYRTATTLNELDLLFSLMFDELLNGSSNVVTKSFAISSADAPNHNTQLH